MKNTWVLLAITTFSVLALTAIRVGAQSAKPTSETYSWSGELVEFDANRSIVTVKSPVSGEQAHTELARIQAGDRIVLTWSGFDTYADGISRAVRYDATKESNEPFTLTADFVAYEPQRKYVTIRFQVPAASVEALKTLKPGNWVSAMARHRPASDSDAIMAVNPYGMTFSRVSTSTN